MKHKLLLLVTILAFGLAIVPGGAQTARAAGSANAYLSCAGVEVVGTSNFAPLTIIASSNNITLAFKQYAFSGTASFDIFIPFSKSVPQGSAVRVRVTDTDTVLIDRTINCTGGIWAGPNIPTGFVQRTITCTVTVRDLPGGNEVAGAVILAGQRWYVSKTSTADKSGKAWTAIFVSGYEIPYIPTACVAAS